MPDARYYYIVGTSSAVDIQSESSPVSSDSSQTQPCTCSAADGLCLEMSVDEVNESEDKINDVFIDSDDKDTDID